MVKQGWDPLFLQALQKPSEFYTKLAWKHFSKEISNTIHYIFKGPKT